MRLNLYGDDIRAIVQPFFLYADPTQKDVVYMQNTSLFRSTDAGKTWADATLGKDLGKYSFREWELGGVKLAAGAHELKVRATSQSGEIQPLEAQWNPNGYLRTVVETTRVTAA